MQILDIYPPHQIFYLSFFESPSRQPPHKSNELVIDLHSLHILNIVGTFQHLANLFFA